MKAATRGLLYFTTMARIIYSGLVSSINGSIAGTTFQRSAYGHTVKKKANIVNPNRAKQTARKQTMQVVSQQWRALSAATRSAWAAYALAFPVASRLNPSSFLSGHALFLRTNMIRQLAGQSLFTTAPTMISDSLLVGAVEIDRVGGTLIYFNDSDSDHNNLRTLCYVSSRIGVTQLYDRTKTRFMDSFMLTAADQVDITAPFLAQFGQLPNTGDNVFLRATYYSTVNGQVIDSNPVNIVVG
jgi:hypothetical protein